MNKDVRGGRSEQDNLDMAKPRCCALSCSIC